MNPAIALGILFAGWIGNGIDSLTYIWLYPVIAILGGFLALLFFEFLFKKTQMLMYMEEEEDTIDETLICLIIEI